MRLCFGQCELYNESRKFFETQAKMCATGIHKNIAAICLQVVFKCTLNQTDELADSMGFKHVVLNCEAQ